MPLVSIIVPVHNAEPYLRRTLDSLLGQSHRELEVLAVDDGSTDGSAAIAAERAAREPGRLRAIRQENRGAASARNAGIEAARGEWIMFLDADDWVEPCCAERLLARARETDADIVDAEYFIDAEARPPRNSLEGLPTMRAIWESLKVGPLSEDPRWLLVHPACCWNKLYRASLFRDGGIRFPEGLPSEDLATVPRLLARAARIAPLREPLFHYVQHPGSLSFRIARSWRGLFEVFSLLKRDFEGRWGEELQFLAASRLAGGTASLLAKTGTPLKDFRELRAYLDREFPGWQRNPYLPGLLSGKTRVSLGLMRARAYGLLRLLAGGRQALSRLLRGRA